MPEAGQASQEDRTMQRNRIVFQHERLVLAVVAGVLAAIPTVVVRRGRQSAPPLEDQVVRDRAPIR